MKNHGKTYGLFIFLGRFEARHFSGLFWSIIGVPPPDFEVISDTTLFKKRWGVVPLGENLGKRLGVKRAFYGLSMGK